MHTYIHTNKQYTYRVDEMQASRLVPAKLLLPVLLRSVEQRNDRRSRDRRRLGCVQCRLKLLLGHCAEVIRAA